jgi:hypothetical protein
LQPQETSDQVHRFLQFVEAPPRATTHLIVRVRRVRTCAGLAATAEVQDALAQNFPEAAGYLRARHPKRLCTSRTRAGRQHAALAEPALDPSRRSILVLFDA